MLNYIWLGLVIGAIVLAGFNGTTDAVTEAAFSSAKKAVMEIALPLVGVMALWLGIMRLAEQSGCVALIARGLRPLLRRLFPEVPPDHPAMGSIVMNMAANMLGLGNAATALGLRAMTHLESLNPRPGTATNAMCTFLAINTSSIQLIPATAVGIMAVAGSREPTAIIGTALMATAGAFVVAVTSVKFLEKLPVFRLPDASPAPLPRSGAPSPAPDPVPSAVPDAVLSPNPGTRGWLALGAVLALFAWWFFRDLSSPAAAPGGQASGFGLFVGAISKLAIPFFLAFFPLYAAAKKVRVYEEFVEGAKEGFNIGVKIIPYLVAILVAVGMFRAAGGIDQLGRLLGPALAAVGFPLDLLPLALIRPLSGSGATGLFADLVRTFGPDSFIARTGGTIVGSTETTFYVLAVYFGSVGIRKTRHAVAAGLAADATAIILSVTVCRLMFA